MEYFTIIFALAISVFALWFSIRLIRLYLKVKKWDRIPAKVTLKEMFIHSKVSTSQSPYGIKVNYTYQYKNTEHAGHMIYLSELINAQSNHMKSSAENRLDKIKDIMPVYVNPSDPKQAVMFCEGIGFSVFIFCLGLLSLLIAISKIV